MRICLNMQLTSKTFRTILLSNRKRWMLITIGWNVKNNVKKNDKNADKKNTLNVCKILINHCVRIRHGRIEKQ